MINSEKLKKEYAEISGQLSSEDVLRDRKKYAQLAKRFSHLEKIIKLFDRRDNYLKEKEKKIC